ncbi:hypothetical protein FOL47_002031, partial [Perkinsus chesapeaki]
MADRRWKAGSFVGEAQAQGRNLRVEVQDFIHGALAKSTRKSFTAAENLFLRIIFGNEGRGELYPLSGSLLLLYIYVMSKVGYAPSTIRTYVAGLKTRNIESGHRLTKLECERVKRAVKAAEKQGIYEVPVPGRDGEKIVLRPGHLRAVRRRGATEDPYWIVMLTCVFALLRARECLALKYGDIRFAMKGASDVMTLRIRKSKCDQLRRGAVLTVGCAKKSCRRPCGEPLCPVHNMYQYLHKGVHAGWFAPNTEDCIFVNPELPGEAVTYNGYLSNVRAKFSSVDDLRGFVVTHAMRRSGANWLWHASVPLFNIREFGRWSTRGTLEDRYLSGASKSQQHLYSAAMLTG